MIVPQFDNIIKNAFKLINVSPDYHKVSKRLERLKLVYHADLPDRARVTLRNTIILGPEALLSSPLSLAGTLVHEEFHTRQNPFHKTRSFWLGVFNRQHPMARYEWPAYHCQIRFLINLSQLLPDMNDQCINEAKLVLLSYISHYGEPIFDRAGWDSVKTLL